MNRRTYIIWLSPPEDPNLPITHHIKYMGIVDGNELMLPYWIEEVENCPDYDLISQKVELEWEGGKACFTLENRHIYDDWLNEHLLESPL